MAAAVVTVAMAAGCTSDEGDGGVVAPPSSTTTMPAPPLGSDTSVPGGGADTTGGDGSEAAVRTQRFVTRPDLTPATVSVSVARSTSRGLIFLAPKKADAQTGPLMVDDEGEVVWAYPRDEAVSDFKVQRWDGKPVLTWWEGRTRGYGVSGGYTIMDASYQEVARIEAGNGLVGDLHDMQLTPRGTALILAYEPEEADLSAMGGPEDGYVLANYIQEIDVESGEVLFEWNAADHVPMSDSYTSVGHDAAGTEVDPFDWFHINSVEVDRDGSLLVSARNTQAVYSIDRSTGNVRWRLGGKSSDFTIGAGAAFAWQHDARRLPNGRISLLDNRGAGAPPATSRAIVLEVDEAAGRAELVREHVHPDGVFARTQANMQVLESGAAMVGWGSAGRLSEFSPAGEMTFDATIGPADCYRVFRFAWTGQPTSPPDASVTALGDGRLDVHASWNGATEVAEWRIVDASDPDDLHTLDVVAREGFETSVAVDPPDGLDEIAVQALNADGVVLGTSARLRVEPDPAERQP